MYLNYSWRVDYFSHVSFWGCMQIKFVTTCAFIHSFTCCFHTATVAHCKVEWWLWKGAGGIFIMALNSAFTFSLSLSLFPSLELHTTKNVEGKSSCCKKKQHCAFVCHAETLGKRESISFRLKWENCFELIEKQRSERLLLNLRIHIARRTMYVPCTLFFTSE